jgi:hypothetical protein
MSIERRRSDRLMLTIPLRVIGTDEYGETFECEAQTIDVNRHGARIRISRLLHSGEQVRIINKVNRREATFRVAGPLIPLTEKGGEFGVLGPISSRMQKESTCGLECLDPDVDLWGIRFPAASTQQDSAPKALLACRQCGQTELIRLSLVEVDVLESSGILQRHCPKCDAVTPWGYAESELTGESSASGAEGDQGVASTDSASTREKRRHRRAVLQLPTLVRDYFGGVEITKSENVSKGGICFASEKNYQLGEGVMVACPCDKAGQNIEVPAQIVSRREIEGTNRKIYGLRYKGKSY